MDKYQPLDDFEERKPYAEPDTMDELRANAIKKMNAKTVDNQCVVAKKTANYVDPNRHLR